MKVVLISLVFAAAWLCILIPLYLAMAPGMARVARRHRTYRAQDEDAGGGA